MHVHRRAALAVVIGAGLLVACPGLSSVASANSSGKTYFFANVALLQTPRVRPSSIAFDADGNNSLTSVHWSSWGGSQARGIATEHHDNCKPSCAGGHVSRIRVRILLSSRGRFGGREMYRAYKVSPISGRTGGFKGGFGTTVVGRGY